MSDAPERIWLQWGESDGTAFVGEGVTWCRDKIDDTDVEYALAARLRELEAENAMLSELNYAKLIRERDEARADVERLTAEATRIVDQQAEQIVALKDEVERLRAELEHQTIDPLDWVMNRGDGT